MLRLRQAGLIFWGVFFCSLSFGEVTPARSSWVCREAGTIWTGASIFSCGVGEGETESLARRHALANAYEELETVCLKSRRCQPENIEITPARMECGLVSAGRFVCYRGLRAVLTFQGAGTVRESNRSIPEIPNTKTQIKTFEQLHSITKSIARSMETLF